MYVVKCGGTKRNYLILSSYRIMYFWSIITKIHRKINIATELIVVYGKLKRLLFLIRLWCLISVDLRVYSDYAI